jgi:hypothetical protein
MKKILKKSKTEKKKKGIKPTWADPNKYGPVGQAAEPVIFFLVHVQIHELEL